jgi:MFS family permease
MQGMMTVGQIIGPLAGAFVAARLGFRGSFVVGAGVLAGCAVLVALVADSAPPTPERSARSRRGEGARVLAVSTLVLGASTQVFFLPAVLPQVVASLGVGDDQTLRVGGALVFVSGIAAALGSLLAPRLAALGADRRVMGWLMVASSALLLGLGPLSSLWAYAAVLFAQVLCVAPVFPIAVGAIAQRGSGGAIGFVNSARIAASFLGPVLSTTVLSWSSTAVLYAALALLGLAFVPIAFALSPSPPTPGGRPASR